MARGEHREDVWSQGGYQRIDAGLFGQRRGQFQSRAVADRDAVVEPVLAGPLGKAADHIDGLAVDFPALEFVLTDGAHGPADQHAPFAFGDIRHRHRLAVDDRGYGADAERGVHLENVAAHRAFQVVHVLGRGEHVEIEAGTAFAVDIDGVALVEVDAPRNVLGFPPQALVPACELHGGAPRVPAAHALEGRLVAITHYHESGLARGEN